MADAQATTSRIRALTVSMDHRPGMLARASRALARAGVNVEAVEAEVLGKRFFFRFYTKDLELASRTLRENGYIVTESDLIEVVMPNEPGHLASVCEALATAGVNIESCFGSSWGDFNQSRLFLRMSDPAKGYQVLQKRGFHAYRTIH